jgi:tRNA(Ile)-lysidine synthase
VGASTAATTERLERSVAHVLGGRASVVLAVSGGVDSMVLLEAAARAARETRLVVATFDHGTGAHATAGATLAARRAMALGLEAVVGRAAAPSRDEAGLRRARWRFLSEVAHGMGAPVATAHTRDDQVETVLMRVLRGAGARGLAGLAAPGTILRPLLDTPREAVAAYARARGVRWVEDPSNRSPAHLRNRVRHELLPALRAARPTLPGELLATGRRAAAWRRDVEAAVAALADTPAEGELLVATDRLRGYDANALSVVWPALAARAGATLDWRGTRRLAAFTRASAVGARMPLSGGFEVVRRRDGFTLRRRANPVIVAEPRSLAPGVRIGAWHFRETRPDRPMTLWSAALPAGDDLVVRSWRPGDRMRPAGAETFRRVKGLLRDAGIAGPDRAGWPVVLSGGEIVWIPGVRRSDAATERPGRPCEWFICERSDG